LHRKKGVKREVTALAVIVAITVTLICYRNFSLFVLPPNGSSEGATLLIERIEKSEFIDNPEAMCDRLQRNEKLTCRSGLLSQVAERRSLLDFPYSTTIHLLSNIGSVGPVASAHTHSHKASPND
jgi:hypothetical protein